MISQRKVRLLRRLDHVALPLLIDAVMSKGLVVPYNQLSDVNKQLFDAYDETITVTRTKVPLHDETIATHRL